MARISYPFSYPLRLGAGILADIEGEAEISVGQDGAVEISGLDVLVWRSADDLPGYFRPMILDARDGGISAFLAPLIGAWLREDRGADILSAVGDALGLTAPPAPWRPEPPAPFWSAPVVTR